MANESIILKQMRAALHPIHTGREAWRQEAAAELAVRLTRVSPVWRIGQRARSLIFSHRVVDLLHNPPFSWPR